MLYFGKKESVFYFQPLIISFTFS